MLNDFVPGLLNAGAAFPALRFSVLAVGTFKLKLLVPALLAPITPPVPVMLTEVVGTFKLKEFVPGLLIPMGPAVCESETEVVGTLMLNVFVPGLDTAIAPFVPLIVTLA